MDRDTCRSRGFAFVEMYNAEDGEKAIASLNGTQIGAGILMSTRAKVERAGRRINGFGKGNRNRDRRWQHVSLFRNVEHPREYELPRLRQLLHLPPGSCLPEIGVSGRNIATVVPELPSLAFP